MAKRRGRSAAVRLLAWSASKAAPEIRRRIGSRGRRCMGPPERLHDILTDPAVIKSRSGRGLIGCDYMASGAWSRTGSEEGRVRQSGNEMDVVSFVDPIQQQVHRPFVDVADGDGKREIALILLCLFSGGLRRRSTAGETAVATFSETRISSLIPVNLRRFILPSTFPWLRVHPSCPPAARGRRPVPSSRYLQASRGLSSNFLALVLNRLQATPHVRCPPSHSMHPMPPNGSPS